MLLYASSSPTNCDKSSLVKGHRFARAIGPNQIAVKDRGRKRFGLAKEAATDGIELGDGGTRVALLFVKQPDEKLGLRRRQLEEADSLRSSLRSWSCIVAMSVGASAGGSDFEASSVSSRIRPLQDNRIWIHRRCAGDLTHGLFSRVHIFLSRARFAPRRRRPASRSRSDRPLAAR